MLYLLKQFALAVFATLGFSVIFRVPARHIPICVIIGGIGWISYFETETLTASPVLGCFIGACMVGLLSGVAAHLFKDATTIFVIPGILCLVPGSKIFYTMESLLQHNMENAVTNGIEMLMMAGAIATGLLVMYSCTAVIKRLRGSLQTGLK